MTAPVGQSPSDSFRWGTVARSTATEVRVRLDGDTSAIDVQPDLLITRPEVGERVWVQQHGRRLIIIGRAFPLVSVAQEAAEERHG